MPSILDRAAPVHAPTLRPLNDLVYVRQDKLPEKEGNFWLPDSTRKHKATRYGTVLAVGPGRLVCYDETDGGTSFADCCQHGMSSSACTECREPCWITKRLPLSVKPGDRVAFMDYAGNCVGLETDPSLLLMREEEILAVLRG